jgi:hypothetical protein
VKKQKRTLSTSSSVAPISAATFVIAGEGTEKTQEHTAETETVRR